MARIRSFRPDLWDCDEFAQMSPAAQICLFRLMTHVSDEGRIKCRPAFLMSRLYPDGDVGRDWLAALLEEVCSAGFAVPYESDGKPYLAILWNDKASPIRQVINRPTESSIPAHDAESSKRFNSWLSEHLMESLKSARRERLTTAGSEDSVSDSRGKGRDWTGPDWTGKESPGRSLSGPSSGSAGRRSVSGSGSAGGLTSASAPAVGGPLGSVDELAVHLRRAVAREDEAAERHWRSRLRAHGLDEARIAELAGAAASGAPSDTQDPQPAGETR